MDILSTKILDIGSSCYFLCASIENPFIYTRCLGRVVKKQINDDNIGYWITFDEILESSEYIKKFVHRNTFRLWNMTSNRGQMKELTCFDLTVNMTSFNSTFAKRYKNFTIPLTSVLVYDNRQDLDKYFDKTIQIMDDHLSKSFEIITIRKNLR